MDSQNREPSAVSRAGSSRGVLSTAADEAAAPRSASSAAKRLQQELMTLMTSCDRGISAFPEGENLFSWIATIEGPRGTVFEKAVYKLRLSFPANYPYQSPRVRFETPCFHPNVDTEGHICVDILQDEWSALLDVRTVLLSIQSLLGEPNVDSPLNEYAAKLWNDKEEYQKERKLFEEGHDYENGSHAAKAGDH